ncbi:hypothetical protein C3Y87_01320 [Carbonactinospora thermoautotrophica]|nr:hypothetical protein [Carbonactinospora thermoautotrophica]
MARRSRAWSSRTFTPRSPRASTSGAGVGVRAEVGVSVGVTAGLNVGVWVAVGVAAVVGLAAAEPSQPVRPTPMTAAVARASNARVVDGTGSPSRQETPRRGRHAAVSVTLETR